MPPKTKHYSILGIQQIWLDMSYPVSSITFSMSIALGITTFLLSLSLCLLFRKLAPSLGLLDIKGSEARKDHIGNPALVGGAAIFLTTLIMSIVWLAADHFYNFLPLFVGMGLFLLIGLYDDARHIPALKKLALQILTISFVVIAFDIQLQNLGYLIFSQSLLTLGKFGILLTILFILAYINAFNFIDGIDGLSGMIALYTVFFFGLIAAHGDIVSYPTFFLVLFSTVFGFIILNLRTYWRRKALVFLGDNGSLSLSFAIALLAITLANQTAVNPGKLPPPIVYAFLLAYPVFDMISVMLYRLSIGKSIFAADTNHLHHLLKNSGISVTRTTMILSSLSAAYGGLGLLLWQAGLQDNRLFILWLGCFVFHMIVYVGFRKICPAK